MVFSKYHTANHCICPDAARCRGSRCSVGHGVNGRSGYHSKVQGFHSECADCNCDLHNPTDSFNDIRARREMWIVGTHHKTGSFLAAQIWGDEHQLVQPSLKVHVNSFRPIQEKKWRKLSDTDVDVVITFHATGINADLETILGRPYRFVHIIRDPVAQLISAYVYEIERITHRNETGAAGVHDKYLKTVQNHMDDPNYAGLFALADFMKPELEDMQMQYAVSELDHNAINIRLEDFTLDFEDTLQRMFTFLGVPESQLKHFMRNAMQEDLTKHTDSENKHDVHVTSGKYDKEPLRKLLLDHPSWGGKTSRHAKCNELPISYFPVRWLANTALYTLYFSTTVRTECPLPVS